MSNLTKILYSDNCNNNTNKCNNKNVEEYYIFFISLAFIFCVNLCTDQAEQQMWQWQIGINPKLKNLQTVFSYIDLNHLHNHSYILIAPRFGKLL